MATMLEKYKGIHPGFILERELKKRGVVKSHFAQLVKEHPQTLNDIYKGRRKLTLALSFKIDDALSLPEGTMYNLQAQFEMQDYIKKFRRKVPAQVSKLRPVLFWDTDIDKIDWEHNAEAVIKRVFERGNHEEQEAIMELYGEKMVQVSLKDLPKIDLSKP